MQKYDDEEPTVATTGVIAGVAATSEAVEGEKKQKVDPFSVESEGKIDYEKLIKEFGSTPLEKSLVDRMQKLTGWWSIGLVAFILRLLAPGRNRIRLTIAKLKTAKAVARRLPSD
jgi:hypothetical protein